MIEVKEAVARAICEACDDEPDWDGEFSDNQYRWQDYLESAEAAIKAHNEWHDKERWHGYWSEKLHG